MEWGERMERKETESFMCHYVMDIFSKVHCLPFLGYFNDHLIFLLMSY